jgi:hypothetical protein
MTSLDLDYELLLKSAVKTLIDLGCVESADHLRQCSISEIDVVEHWMDGAQRIDGLAIELRCTGPALRALTAANNQHRKDIEQTLGLLLPSGMYLKELSIKARMVAAGELQDEEVQHDLPNLQERHWPAGYLRLFISHHSSIKIIAGELQAELKRFGVWSFVAHNDISPTAEWEKEIENSLATSHALCALLTKNFHESYWTDQEVGWMLGRKKCIIPVRLEVDPYGLMRKYQAVAGAGKTGTDLARPIHDVLLIHSILGPFAQLALANALVRSPSYKDSNDIASLLDKVTITDPRVIAAIRLALATNSQVSASYANAKLLRLLEAVKES